MSAIQRVLNKSAAILSLITAVFLNQPLPAATQEQVLTLLEQRILAPGRALSEVQDYCDARVPVMPELNDASSWDSEAARLRAEVLDKVVFPGSASAWRNAKTKVEWLDTIPGGPGYRIKKLRYEALPGMWIPALLYVPDKLSGKVPAVLNVNGHSREGKVYHPKQLRCINLAKRGILALNVEWVGMGQLNTPGFNHASMNQLDLCGSSGLAPFYLSMSRALDLLINHENADPEKIAVTGLSGGGWQTIFISALDTRVKLAVPVAGYSSYLTRTRHMKDLGDSEQTPNDLATIADYTHLTAMMAPRPTLLTYNYADNCCFESVYALEPLLDAARPAFRLHGAGDSLEFHVNMDPGTHNYDRDNREALYRVLGTHFYPGDQELDTVEIPSEDELKTAEELFVELPEANSDFNSLALELAADLPTDVAPENKKAFAAWQIKGRTRLAKTVRAKQYTVTATEADSKKTSDDVTARYWKLAMGKEWTIPAVVMEGANAKGTVLLVADKGRAAVAADAAKLLSQNTRIIAIDPFCIGEAFPDNKPRSGKGLLFPLLVSAVGDRPIGIQASQIAAAARWAKKEFPGNRPVRLMTRGRIAGLAGLIANALETDAIAGGSRHESLESLKQVIEDNRSARVEPELFCAGLLEAFDIEQLAALSRPRQARYGKPE